MQNCQICGRSFDPLGFQVVVPEVGRGFDRIDCARSARALAGPGSRIAAVPLVALAAPVAATAALPATGAAVAAPFPRVLGSTAATLGILAAGTAAVVLLWMRVVGTDTTSYTLGRLTAPPAFGHKTVRAQIATAPQAGHALGAPATAPVEKLVVLASPTLRAAGGATRAATQGRAAPAVPARAATPLSKPGKATTGKGHPKHGKGHQKPKTHGHQGGGHGQGAAAAHGNSAAHAHSGQGKGKNKH
jgi:hypothetical protein